MKKDINSIKGSNLKSKLLMLTEKLPEHSEAQMMVNLKRNWYFPVSAIVFFCLNVVLTHEYFVGMLIGLIAAIVIASQIPSIFEVVKGKRIGFHLAAILSALGVCWNRQVAFYIMWSNGFRLRELDTMCPMLIVILKLVSIVGVILSIFFVYFWILIFWEKMMNIISKSSVFSNVTVAEWIVYGILLLSSLVFMVISFAQTDVFYEPTYCIDIIYTSDSQALMRGDVYLALGCSENDIRQPLFAVFSAPFIGVPYLIGKLLGGSVPVQAMLMNAVQLVLLFAANFMLAKMMKLDSRKRMCFMLLTSCTYTHLLFTLMMEQYIIAYFWLAFCLYLITEKQHPDPLVLYGAGGTLMTSMILLPFMSEKNPIRHFKEWFADMVKYGIGFVALLGIFARFDVFLSLPEKISVLTKFTGRDLTLMDKIYQYLAFIPNYFLAPDAGVGTVDGHISWQLHPVTAINFAGIIILLLVIVSTILNRKKKSSLLAAGWAAFSVIILLVLGWGTKENGLILYSLYFGWAFLVLLFQLVEKLEDKLNVKFLLPILSVGSAAALTVVNIPAIMELLDFAIANFPV